MKQSQKIEMQKMISTLAIIMFAVVLRLIPHPPNFAPIAAMALFGGCYLDKRYALIVPFVAMFFSDLFIGFHGTMLFVYGSFLITGLIGIWLKKHKSAQFVFGASLVSSTLFFLITNFGVWLMGELYPGTITGLFESYTMAVPFFRNTLIGDLFYVGLFFGGYELALMFLRKLAAFHTNLSK